MAGMLVGKLCSEGVHPVKAEGCMERGGLDRFIHHPLLLVTKAIVEVGIGRSQKFEKVIKFKETVKT